MSNPIQDALAFINANPEEQKKKLFKQDILDIDEFLSSPYQAPSPVKTLTEEQEFSVDKYEVDPERERQFLEASAQLSGQPLPAASKKYTLDDLEKDEEFGLVATRFMESIGANENIFEYLRDSEYSLSAAAQRAIESGQWSDQQIQDYNYLRNRFDNADIGGLRQVAGLVKDVAIDFLVDPLNLATLLVGGGVGTAAAKGGLSLAAKAANGRMLRKTASKLAESRVFEKTLEGGALGATEGLLYTSVLNPASQITDINLGVRDSFSGKDFATEVSLGTAFGTAFGGLFGGGFGYFTRDNIKKLSKTSDENSIINELDEAIEDNPKDPIKKSGRFEDAISGFFGKPTTKFRTDAKNSSTLSKFLGILRYDFAKTGISGDIDEAVKMGYGNKFQAREGLYNTAFKKSINNLIRTTFGNLTRKDNAQLRLVLSNPKAKVDMDGNPITQEIKQTAKEVKKVFNAIKRDAESHDLKFGEIQDYFPREYIIDMVRKNATKMKELVIKYGHAVPLDEIPKVKAVNAYGQDIKVVLKDQGTRDEDYFGVDFIKQAKKTLPEGASDEQIKIEAQELKAQRIINDMIERELTPYDLRPPKPGTKTANIQPRAFYNIPDEKLIELGVLEDDVLKGVGSYITNMSKLITRQEFNMRTLVDFEDNYLLPIQRELREAGYSPDEIKERSEGLVHLYKRITGLEVPRFKGKYARGVSDFLKITQQMAHLPLATLSSVTEPFILLSRFPITEWDKPTAEFAKAMGSSMKNVFTKFNRAMSNIRGKEVRGLADLDMPDKVDAMEFMLAMEQAAMDRMENMFGEGLSSEAAKLAQNVFFSLNLLQPWTQTVQTAAFTSGKKLIQLNARALATGKNRFGGKLTKAQRKNMTQQLREIGVDEKNAISWYKNSTVKGKFNEEKAFNSAFYHNEMSPAAALFANEIILNPSVVQANKPLLFSTPWGQLAFQFAGYPTAFNNVVLKNMVKSVKDMPLQNAPRVLGTTALMTGIAIGANALRSEGRSLEKEDVEVVVDGVTRWGGLGPVDYAYRAFKNKEIGGGTVGTLIKSPSGPLVADIVDATLYRTGPTTLVTQNLPLYSALPFETRQDLKEWSKSVDKQYNFFNPSKKEKEQEFIRIPRAKGGEVNVPNAPVEPDERIDKMTGVPYNVQAGDILTDEEERRGFVFGGLARAVARKFPKIRNPLKTFFPDSIEEVELFDYYTQMGKEKPLLKDDSKIELYDDTDLLLDEGPEYYSPYNIYISLPNDTNGGRVNAFDNTDRIGVKAIMQDRMDPVEKFQEGLIKDTEVAREEAADFENLRKQINTLKSLPNTVSKTNNTTLYQGKIYSANTLDLSKSKLFGYNRFINKKPEEVFLNNVEDLDLLLLNKAYQEARKKAIIYNDSVDNDIFSKINPPKLSRHKEVLFDIKEIFNGTDKLINKISNPKSLERFAKQQNISIDDVIKEINTRKNQAISTVTRDYLKELGFNLVKLPDDEFLFLNLADFKPIKKVEAGEIFPELNDYFKKTQNKSLKEKLKEGLDNLDISRADEERLIQNKARANYKIESEGLDTIKNFEGELGKGYLSMKDLNNLKGQLGRTNKLVTGKTDTYPQEYSPSRRFSIEELDEMGIDPADIPTTFESPEAEQQYFENLLNKPYALDKTTLDKEYFIEGIDNFLQTRIKQSELPLDRFAKTYNETDAIRKKDLVEFLQKSDEELFDNIKKVNVGETNTVSLTGVIPEGTNRKMTSYENPSYISNPKTRKQAQHTNRKNTLAFSITQEREIKGLNFHTIEQLQTDVKDKALGPYRDNIYDIIIKDQLEIAAANPNVDGFAISSPMYPIELSSAIGDTTERVYGKIYPKKLKKLLGSVGIKSSEIKKSMEKPAMVYRKKEEPLSLEAIEGMSTEAMLPDVYQGAYAGDTYIIFTDEIREKILTKQFRIKRYVGGLV